MTGTRSDYIFIIISPIVYRSKHGSIIIFCLHTIFVLLVNMFSRPKYIRHDITEILLKVALNTTKHQTTTNYILT